MERKSLKQAWKRSPQRGLGTAVKIREEQKRIHKFPAASHNGLGGLWRRNLQPKTMLLLVSSGLRQDLDSHWEQGGQRTGNCHNPEKNCGHGQRKTICPSPMHSLTRFFLEFAPETNIFVPRRGKPLPKGKKWGAATTDVRDASKSLSGWSKTKAGNFELNPGANARGQHLSSLSTLQTSQRMPISLF